MAHIWKENGIYSRYRLVRYRIRRKIGYNAIYLYVCVSVENRLERKIAYSVDFFQSQVPRTKRYPVYIIPFIHMIHTDYG